MKNSAFFAMFFLIAMFSIGMIVWMVAGSESEHVPQSEPLATRENREAAVAPTKSPTITPEPALIRASPEQTATTKDPQGTVPPPIDTPTAPPSAVTPPQAASLISGLAPAPTAIVPKMQTQRRSDQAPRTELSLTGEWRFIKREVAGGFAPQLDEGLWTTVSVPHTWNVEDGQDGPQKVSLMGGYYRGMGWYRRKFQVPTEERGRSAHLIFEGVSQQCVVYLNGEKVGEHKGGFASFCFDVTAFLKPEGTNVLAVRASNAYDRNIMPLRGDFTIFGGIYRPVRLVFVEPVHFAMRDDGTTGMQVVQRNVSKEQAQVEVETLVENRSVAAEPIEVVVNIKDKAGVVLASQSQMVTVKPGEPQQLSFPLTIANPHLWNGRIDPYLHQVTARIVHKGGVIDELQRHLGLRFFGLTADAGFSLNGAPYDLYGVCMHQGSLEKGWANSAADQRRDIALVAELGARFIRLAHYQHSQETYRACDEHGILVWSEIPLVYSSSNTREFSENCQQQFLEMVRQNRSYSSVICWGLFNHVAAMDHQIKQLQDLTRIAREVDPTRFTTGAATHAEETQTTRITDTIAFNVYFGWYLPDYNLYATWADDFRAKNPERIFGLSEYGAGASINEHSEVPQQPQLLPMKKTPHPEEYQALYHEEVWLQIRKRKYLWCKLIWTMFDFAADERSDAELSGRNDKGLVTIDRQVKKDAFFWYKANWTDEPMLHLTGKRFAQRTQRKVDIKAYTTCESAMLRVNGKVFDSIPAVDRRLIWKGVELQPGNNVITVTAVQNGKAITEQALWKAP